MEKGKNKGGMEKEWQVGWGVKRATQVQPGCLSDLSDYCSLSCDNLLKEVSQSDFPDKEYGSRLIKVYGCIYGCK